MKWPKHNWKAVQLPASRLAILIRQPTGREDLLVQEPGMSPGAMCHAWAGRLARMADGAPVQVADLLVSDLEALLLLLRQSIAGDGVRAEIACRAPACGARLVISYRISEYLGSEPPRTPRGVEQAETGWFRLAGSDARFRLPTEADLLAIECRAHRHRELVRLCVEPADVAPALRHRMEKAMEALAPPLSRTLAGKCPECGRPLEVYFDVRSYVMRELCQRAAGIYQEIHLLALHYKWPEEKILALPRNRRLQYVEMLRNQGVAA